MIPSGCRRRPDLPVERRADLAVEPLKQDRAGISAPASGTGKRADGCGQQFVDEALGQRLGRVDQDELRALLLVGVGDERGDADRETVDPGVADRGAALLAVDDPAGLVLVGDIVADRDDAACRAARIRPQGAPGRGSNRTRLSKAMTSALGIMGAVGFEVPADRGDVREDLGALVALDLGVAVAVDPGDRREQWQLLAVDGEAVEHPAAHLGGPPAQAGAAFAAGMTRAHRRVARLSWPDGHAALLAPSSRSRRCLKT